MIIHKADHAIYLARNAIMGESGVTFAQASALLFVRHTSGRNQKAVERHTETRGAAFTVLLNTIIGYSVTVPEN